MLRTLGRRACAWSHVPCKLRARDPGTSHSPVQGTGTGWPHPEEHGCAQRPAGLQCRQPWPRADLPLETVRERIGHCWTAAGSAWTRSAARRGRGRVSVGRLCPAPGVALRCPGHSSASGCSGGCCRRCLWPRQGPGPPQVGLWGATGGASSPGDRWPRPPALAWLNPALEPRSKAKLGASPCSLAARAEPGHAAGMDGATRRRPHPAPRDP